LTDFGFTKEFDPSKGLDDSFVGTPGYLDPLVYMNNPRKYSFGSDIWSVGIVLHELMFGLNSY